MSGSDQFPQQLTQKENQHGCTLQVARQRKDLLIDVLIEEPWVALLEVSSATATDQQGVTRKGKGCGLGLQYEGDLDSAPRTGQKPSDFQHVSTVLRQHGPVIAQKLCCDVFPCSGGVPLHCLQQGHFNKSKNMRSIPKATLHSYLRQE